MAAWLPHLALEAELEELDAKLAAAPQHTELLYSRAGVLAKLGRAEEARTAYLAVLDRASTHFGALNDLGALLQAEGFHTAACTAYAEAVKHHPHEASAHINLANALAKTGDAEGGRRHFEAVLAREPNHPEAHQGLSYLLGDLGEEEAAREHRIKGFKDRPILILPYRGKDLPVAVLLLAPAAGGTVPVRHHLDDKTFFTSVLFTEFYNPDFKVPPHQVVFNAVGDTDLAPAALEQAERIIRRTDAPVINHPAAVRKTGRVENAARLGTLPSVITPKLALLPRGEITAEALAARGFSFPLLLRAPGFHTGMFFVRVENAAELPAAVEALPGRELLAIEYLDARGADGKIRKYRVMMIDGKLYPLHAAVSRDWKVHYFSADMAENPEHRAEDEAFLTRMPEILGSRAMQALAHIQTTLELNYAGADFGLNANGELLLFEANATMVVNPPEPDARWDYRRAPVQHALDAIRQLLLSRVTPGRLATVSAA